MKKAMAAALLVLLALLLPGCAYAEGSPEKDFTMHEPEYEGLEVNGKPKFRLSWDAYPGATSYEIAFYAEGEDAYGRGPFAIRSTKGVYGGDTDAVAVFLQGVYTDTVTYRIKVRPDLREENADPVWSNLWEIRFVNGEYTVSGTEDDFDRTEEKPEEQAEKPAARTPEKRAVPLEHSYPEPLLTYLARERGKEEPYLPEEIAKFSVAVNHCEYGEPVQTITDPETVRAFAEALRSVTVTGKVDSVSSTETYYAYYAEDASGNGIFSFSVQSGLLERSDGRYGLTGLEGLLSLDGVLYTEGWNAYWEEQSQKEQEYGRKKDVTGLPLTEAAGYSISRVAGKAPEGILSIRAYIDWNTEPGRLDTSDRAEIAAIWEALEGITVGERVKSPGGQMWHIIFTYLSESGTFCESAYLEFHGSAVEIGDRYYALDGLDRLYGSVDSGLLRYLRDYAEAPKVKPSY